MGGFMNAQLADCFGHPSDHNAPDWEQWENVERWLNLLYGYEEQGVNVLRSRIAALLYQKTLRLDVVLRWIETKIEDPRGRYVCEECIKILIRYASTQAERVMIVNTLSVFRAATEWDRACIMWKIIDHGDLSGLGIGWMSGFTFKENIEDFEDTCAAMEQSHAIEFLLDGSDAIVQRIDAWIVDRLNRGKGAPEGASKLTAEFFATAAVAAMPDTPKHIVVRLASTAILKIVGEMSWESRKAEIDTGHRPVHQKLKVLDWLIGRIVGVMTNENAGIVLRWAMIKDHRHHDWVRECLTRAAVAHGWRLVPVTTLNGEVVVTWKVGERTYVVQQGADPEKIGELCKDGQVWVPRERFLGEPVSRSGRRVVYRAPLHPAMLVAKAMEENPDLFPL